MLNISPKTQKYLRIGVAALAFALMLSGSIAAAFSLPGTALSLAVCIIITGIFLAALSLLSLYKTYYPDTASVKTNAQTPISPLTTQTRSPASPTLSPEQARTIESHILLYLSAPLSLPKSPQLIEHLKHLDAYYKASNTASNSIPRAIQQALRTLATPPSMPRQGSGIFYALRSDSPSSSASEDTDCSTFELG